MCLMKERKKMKKLGYFLSIFAIMFCVYNQPVKAQEEQLRAYAYQMPVYVECTGRYISKKIFGFFTTNTPITGSYYVYEYDEIAEKVFFSITYNLSNQGIFNPFRSNSYSYAFTEVYQVKTETCPSRT